jgi:hypothetical protein
MDKVENSKFLGYFLIFSFSQNFQVLKLKERIESELGKDYPHTHQKLIYAG